ncbi:MAG: hypothetical protein ICV70_01050 [Jiangellaceae bacterium]|nr:hypothetical protein [Jiangellaceae bacterium]
MLQDAVSIAVAAVGAVLILLALRRAKSKGWASALQLAAGGFLLVGAAAVGIVEFLAGVALSPLAWAGIAALAVAAVLFVVGQRLEPRRAARTAKPDASRPASRPVTATAEDEDFSDIEAILKKHGIT